MVMFILLLFLLLVELLCNLFPAGMMCHWGSVQNTGTWLNIIEIVEMYEFVKYTWFNVAIFSLFLQPSSLVP
jgi:hypothetical protein